MMKLGEKQVLKAERFRDFGAYLSDGESTVLLPKKEVPEGLQAGDEIEVFLYKDSSDRLIATTRQSALTLHQIALLKVRELSKIGAFLDWGLEKDLLLPFHEQTRRVQAGEEVLAALYIDKSGRLAATMNVYPYLRTDSPYQPDDTVQGRIYEKSDNFGVFVAVDDCYSALIPKQEEAGDLRIGDVIRARVTKVRPDGKLNLAVRRKAYLQLDADAELILKGIDEYEGVLPFDDKVSPEIIKREFGLSKNAFKRAVGHLMKQGLVRIGDRRIYRLENPEQGDGMQ
jgi:predicted RNA-binding protein (virulence factor B family)